MKSITLAGFERTFASDPDPWRTLQDRDEALKRANRMCIWKTPTRSAR